ncbi:tenascin [Drosophila takahashii]|uniref:tenascin n=1 Tax=Drosophila takahashii TaxID=29030 RepID=UPI001CF802B3|nr:tenascin [Drosophila takahashii]
MQAMHSWILILLAGLPAVFRAEDLLELSCTSDAQCAQFERGRCVDLTCVCTARGSGERVACAPLEEKVTNIIGGPCPCPMPDALCHVKWQQCLCAQGFVPSEDRRRCLPAVVPLGGACEFQRQCQLAERFSSCSARQCLCPANFELHKGHCLAVLQSKCTLDKDCGSCGASICLTKLGKCGCAAHFVHNHNMTKCIGGSGFGESCEHSSPCKIHLGPGGRCLDHLCVCGASYYPKMSKEEQEDQEQEKQRITCQPIVPFGALCHHDGDCRMQRISQENLTVPAASMVCKYGECSCSETHRLEDNRCIFVESGALGKRLLLPLLLLQFTMILY